MLSTCHTKQGHLNYKPCPNHTIPNHMSSPIPYRTKHVHKNRTVRVISHRSFGPISLVPQGFTSKNFVVAYNGHYTQHEPEIYGQNIIPFLPP